MRASYKTDYGKYYPISIEQFFDSKVYAKCRDKIQLILTSPPFPLIKKKNYGNLQGQAYIEWFSSLSNPFSELLKDDGSIVIELGNTWESEKPIQSTVTIESLLAFLKSKEANLRLCQQIICHTPTRLPSPAQWTNIERCRLIDSYTTLWWMSRSDYPKADNRNVLRPYSSSMKKLIQRKTYNHGKRPSEHNISMNSFTKDNGGSIMPSVIELESIDNKEARLPRNILKFANTSSNDAYMRRCREKNVKSHPARMPTMLAAFFIEFLTEPGDIVFDPFAGSNTTGYVAEMLGRRWIAVDSNKEYVNNSKLRFKEE
jgi:site-specific DNA-methyltransferase (cytosine-N4-specific)